jgi:hypothetical protein
MKYARIVATYDDDKAQKVIIVGALTEDGHLHPKAEAFGFVVDWCEESESYCRYPFVLEPIDQTSAALSWGGFDDTRSTVDLLGRKLVKGEQFMRSESGQRWRYTIQSVID